TDPGLCWDRCSGPSRFMCDSHDKEEPVDIEVVRGATLFAGLDDEATSALMKFMNPRSLRRGNVLFNEGDAGDELYIVSTGKLKIVRESSNCRENQLSQIVTDEIIGELSFFVMASRTTSRLASTHS